MAEVSLQQPISVEERIPESAKYDKLSSGSVIRGRRTVRFQPSTGTTVASSGGSQIITFRVSDSNAYLDPLASYLTFDAVITQGTVSGGNGGVAWDDTVLSFFNRVQTQFNSVQMDDIVDNDSLGHSLLYSLGDKNAYCQDLGLQAGSWKWNDENYGVGAQSTALETGVAATVNAEYNSEGSVEAVQRRASTYWSTLYDRDGTASSTNTLRVKFAVPLSYFNIGIMKSSKFIPLRNLGILTLHFYTNTVNRALRTGIGADAAEVTSAGSTGMADNVALGGASFELQNLALVTQVLDMDPRYLELVDRVATTSESGLIMDFNTFTNLKQSYNATATATERQVVVSKATTSLRNMYIVRQPSAWRESATRCGITGFPNLGCTGFRVQINSLYIPEYGVAESPTEQYNLGRQAHALLGNQDSLGNTRVDGFIAAESEDSDINGQHVLAVGFDRSANQYLALDGLNTVSSGGTITVTIKDAGSTDAGGTNPVTFNSWVEFTRFLTLRQNAVSVVG